VDEVGVMHMRLCYGDKLPGNYAGTGSGS